MWRASSAERGLPKMRPSRVTSVSAPRTMAWPTARAATSSALATARRSTRTWAASPWYGVSSMEEDITVNENPASRRISARRTEAEARMSFIGNPGISGVEEYYSVSAVRACAGVQRNKRASDDHGFPVFAEDAAEGVGDFADRGIGFDGGEDGGEEVFGSG